MRRYKTHPRRGDIYEELKKMLVEELSKVVVGDPRPDKTMMGPLIEADAVDHMLAAVGEVVELGGKDTIPSAAGRGRA